MLKLQTHTMSIKSQSPHMQEFPCTMKAPIAKKKILGYFCRMDLFSKFKVTTLRNILNSHLLSHTFCRIVKDGWKSKVFITGLNSGIFKLYTVLEFLENNYYSSCEFHIKKILHLPLLTWIRIPKVLKFPIYWWPIFHPTSTSSDH